ncbi:hypothetical protein [Celeribacter naphthalenivorans]|uniref:hypothetical protein n=1 Tax=Celeribacter naphthalenivorans TaxID=1614694 RepID=UPI001CF96924|nr:hypothetical protein [Celeribacter naphthalenivorans]
MIHEFRVRWYQAGFYRAMTEGQVKRAIAIWHRRAGKDEIVLNATRENVFKRPGTYWHCLPQYKQARKALWNGVNAHTGKRRIFEAFPEQIIKRMQDDDMFIEFVNGATWQLLGSDNYDSHVGAGAVQITYSEWALCNPAAWAYHSPMIRETNGLAAFITTPRGNNHAKTMFDTAQASPDTWFSELLRADQTGALTADQLAEAMAEYQDLYGIDLGRAMFEQEYFCSFAGATVGAIYGAEMSRAEQQDRMTLVPINWDYPVHTVWDLGKAVNNPIWCFQVVNGDLRIVDFYVPEEDDLDTWLDWLDNKGYRGNDYVPHDVLRTEWGQKKTRIERLRDKGRKPVRIPMVSVADGQQAGRMAINAAVFHTGDDERGQRVAHGVEGLKSYRREWDDELKRFRDTPVKDWSEHIGSAWRYLGLVWKDKREIEEHDRPKELVYTASVDGSVQGNMSVKDAVDAMVKRRNRARD